MLDVEGNSGSGKLKEGEVIPSDSSKSGAGSCGEVMVDSIACNCQISSSDCCEGGEGGLRGAISITPEVKCDNGTFLPDPKIPLSLFYYQLPDSDCGETWRDVENVDASDESPRTPKQYLFDPFAPGPADVALAPIIRKVRREFRNIVARRLDFHDSCDGFSGERDINNEDDLEEMLLESIYSTILEAILLKQTELFLSEHYHSCSATPETPSLASRLNGIANTCPRTPVKAGTRRARALDVGLCRKLEF